MWTDTGKGDTAVALLKAGAETDKKDMDGCLALDLAPDKDVSLFQHFAAHDMCECVLISFEGPQIHRTGVREGGH